MPHRFSRVHDVTQRLKATRGVGPEACTLDPDLPPNIPSGLGHFRGRGAPELRGRASLLPPYRGGRVEGIGMGPWQRSPQ